ncbi:MLP-like protein 423 [Prunus dulcis]|uniref:MLP-like protein 423 n=1 Tax=Prunus dulcis TaxID=3755 RepID=A0A4Y1QMQ9_PRUDU|nr:MLP-like protein 423 [Prunus dulcis]
MDEYTSPIPPDRLFKALVLDAHNLVPTSCLRLLRALTPSKVMEGQEASSNSTSPKACSELKSVDEENFVYGYTLIEGDALVMEKLEYVSYEVKFEAAEDGGSKNKMVSKYHTKGDFVLQEEDIKAGREKALGMYKVVTPERMFKALVLDAHNICPKLMFSSIKSIDFVEGEGEVGTIKQINFTEASPMRYVKHRIDALDKEALSCTYTFIETNAENSLLEKLEYITYDVKFEDMAEEDAYPKMIYISKKRTLSLEKTELLDKCFSCCAFLYFHVLAQDFDSDEIYNFGHNLLNLGILSLWCVKAVAQFIASVDVTQGDGGAGSIEQVNFTEASHFRYVKHRIDELDQDNFVCKYTMIEGDALGDKLDSIAYEVKFEAASDGSSICKMTSKYNTIGEFEVKEEEIISGKKSAMGIYKVVEAYLLENPHVYS